VATIAERTAGGVSFGLTNEQKALRDLAHDFAEREIRPREREYDEGSIHPADVIAKAHELGLMNVHIPAEYGGPGLGLLEGAVIGEELCWGCSGMGTAIAGNGLGPGTLIIAGTDEQKRRWLPPLVEEPILASFGLTEPDAGSDPGSMRTSARRDGSDWMLNGTKMWITNGTIADVAVVWARTEGGDINGFLVEKGMPGFEAPEMKHKMSLRASVTSELVLKDVRVPEENRFPEVSSLRGPLSCLSEARYGIVWGSVGAARACYESALEYAKERIVFGKPIAGYQLTQQKLAEMALEINRATLVALHLGRMKDEGTLRPEHVSMGKMGNVRGAIGVARSARTILGGNGITLEYPVIRHMNNLETVLTYEGTHEVHTLSVGKALTGENAFR